MKTKISVESVLTKQLCIDTAKYMIWHNVIFMFFLCIGILLTLTFPVFIAMGYSTGGAFVANVGFIPGLALTIIILGAPWYMGKSMYKKNGNQLIKMTFEDMQITVNTKGKVIELAYNEIKKIKYTDKYLFISTKGPDSVVYVLPKKNFAKMDFDCFLAFFNEKISNLSDRI